MSDPAPAQAGLRKAVAGARQAVLKHGPKSSQAKTAQRKVDKAQAVVDACSVGITLRAMKPDEYEDLVAAHPATAEQRKADANATINTETFRPALLAECAEGDMTASDWVEFLSDGRCSTGERRDLYLAALGVNEQARQPDVVLPKELQAMLASLPNSI
jgi:hypothetical protein